MPGEKKPRFFPQFGPDSGLSRDPKDLVNWDFSFDKVEPTRKREYPGEISGTREGLPRQHRRSLSDGVYDRLMSMATGQATWWTDSPEWTNSVDEVITLSGLTRRRRRMGNM